MPQTEAVTRGMRTQDGLSKAAEARGGVSATRAGGWAKAQYAAPGCRGRIRDSYRAGLAWGSLPPHVSGGGCSKCALPIHRAAWGQKITGHKPSLH